MRKSFFSKAIVTVGVMASALALSSMAVFAGTITGESTFDGTSFASSYGLSQGNNSTDVITTLTSGDFTFVAGTSKKIIVDYKQKADFGSGEIYGSINLNGKSSNSGEYITFTTNGAYKASVYYRASGNNRSIGIISGVPEGNVDAIPTDALASYNATGSDVGVLEADLNTAGTYSIVETNGFRIYKIIVTPNAKEDISSSITAVDNLSGNSIVDFTIKDSDNNIYTAINGVYSLKTGTEYTASATGYNDTDFSLTKTDTSYVIEMTSSAVSTYNLTTSDFESDIDQDGYLTADGNYGTDNAFYLTESVRVSSSRIQINSSNVVKFKVPENYYAQLTLTGVNSASGSNLRSLQIVDENNVDYANETLRSINNKANVNFTTSTLSAGTYTIKGQGGISEGDTGSAININSISVLGTLEQIPVSEPIDITTTNSISKPAVAKVGDTYYAVIIIDPTVTGALVEDGSVNLDVTVSVDGGTPILVDEAYETVTINGTEYGAGSFGGNSSQYVYGFNVDASNVTGDVVEYIQGNVAVTQTVA